MDDEKRTQLRNKLLKLEEQHLHEPEVFSKKGIVAEVMKQLVRPALSGLMDSEGFVGSSYELTSLQKSSDFDVQIFLKMTEPKVPRQRRPKSPKPPRSNKAEKNSMSGYDAGQLRGQSSPSIVTGGRSKSPAVSFFTSILRKKREQSGTTRHDETDAPMAGSPVGAAATASPATSPPAAREARAASNSPVRMRPVRRSEINIPVSKPVVFKTKKAKSKPAKPKNKAGALVTCGIPGWRKVRKGPMELRMPTKEFLSPMKVRRRFKGEIDSYLSLNEEDIDIPEVDRITTSESGPATTLHLHDKSGSRFMTIDIVTCVKGQENGTTKELVAKPSYSDCWRISCSNTEKKYFRDKFDTSPRILTMMKIMKLLKENDSQFRLFKSYVYKNLMLKLLQRHGSHTEWQKDNYEMRFVDLIKDFHGVLEEESLPVHFNQEEDLFSSISQSSYRPLKEKLSDVIRGNAFIELLEEIPA